MKAFPSTPMQRRRSRIRSEGDSAEGGARGAEAVQHCGEYPLRAAPALFPAVARIHESNGAHVTVEAKLVEEMLAVAVEAARRAGELQKERLWGEHQIQFKG